MNKISAFPALLLLCLILSLQVVQAQKRTVVQGTVQTPESTTISLSYCSSYLDCEKVSKEAVLDQRNSFKLVLYLPEAVQASLEIGNQSAVLFLEPGDSIRISADGKDLAASIIFQGTNADNSNYLKRYIQAFEANGKANLLWDKMARLDMPDYLTYLDSLTLAKKTMLRQYGEQAKLSPAFVQYANAEYAYRLVNDKLRYPSYSMSLKGLREAPELPADYYEFLKEVPMPRDSFLYSPEYREFLKQYLEYTYEKKLNQKALSGTQQDTEKLALAEELYKGKSLYYVHAFLLNYALSVGKFPDVKYRYQGFLQRYPEGTLNKQLAARYAKVQQLAPGKKAPDFTTRNLEGEQVSLGDYKGKVVYIDFWASWCLPCLKQVPFAKKLKEQFSGQDVVFLYVSVDENEESWRRTIAKHQIVGEHVISPGLESMVPALYDVSLLPVYTLIDRHGNIFDSRAKWPNQEGIAEQLKQALQQ